MWGHRMMAFDGEPAALDALPAPLRWAMRPAMDLDTVRTARQFGQAATAAAEPDFPSARAKLPPDPLAATNRPSMLEGLSRLQLDWVLERLDGYLLRHYEHLADRRMAAVGAGGPAVPGGPRRPVAGESWTSWCRPTSLPCRPIRSRRAASR